MLFLERGSEDSGISGGLRDGEISESKVIMFYKGVEV